MAEATINRSRVCGLRDFYLAKVTENSEANYTTGTPVKLARAINAKISRKKNSEKIYSDDGVEDIVSSYESTDVELEVNALAPQDRALVYGEMYEQGFLVKGQDDLATEVALGYRVKRLNGKYDFVWLYCGKFAEGDEEEFATQEDKPAPKTATIKGSFYARKKPVTVGGKTVYPSEISVDEENLIETYAKAKTAINAWFTKVQEYPAVAG